jgi:serine/threonine-protein kinase
LTLNKIGGLQTLLDRGPLAPDRAVRITEQIATALDAAHEAGLVHRDVKPSNILLDDNNFAYLIDFGIARAAGETGITSTGATIGTWAYMAPERFSGGEIEPSSDIYALACVLYQSLTGQLPFPGPAMSELILEGAYRPGPGRCDDGIQRGTLHCLKRDEI